MGPLFLPKTTVFDLPNLAAHQIPAPQIDWARVPEIIQGYREEQRHEKSLILGDDLPPLTERAADVQFLAEVHEVRYDRVRLADVIPYEQKLSSMLEMAIAEAVRTDKKMILDVYRRHAQDEYNTVFGYLVTLPVQISLAKQPEMIVATLATKELESSLDHRAKLAEGLLTKLMEHRRDADRIKNRWCHPH